MALLRSYTQLILAARQLSDTVDDPFVTDQEVLDRVNEGLDELYDFVVGEYEHRFITSLDFTLSGGAAWTNGINQKPLPADFQKCNGVDKDPDTGNTRTIHTLASYLERNAPYEIAYHLDGSLIKFYRPSRCQGNYRMWYTPQAPYLYDPTIVVTGSDTATASTEVLHFVNGVFDPSFVGATVTIAGATNAQNNGTKTIVAVNGLTDIVVTGLHDETFNPASVTASSSPLGAIQYLTQILSPHYEYIVTNGAIRIRDKKEQDVSVLSARLDRLMTRAKEIFANTNEEPGQVPLTKNGRDGFWSYP
jgi:hypothetical protein